MLHSYLTQSARAFLLVLTLLYASESLGQDRKRGLSISAGGGPQDYRTQLGNGFSLSSENSWHGAVLLQAATPINPSLDLCFFGSMGDLGFSRLSAIGMLLKYQFADGRLLDETSALKPSIGLGGAFNNLSDNTERSLLRDENYLSLNISAGVNYYVFRRIFIGYNLSVGFFLTNEKALMGASAPNEAYFHNALMLGIDLF